MITSRNNPLIIETLKLRKKKYRDHKKECLLDGSKLFLEAQKSRIDITNVFCTQEFESKYKTHLSNKEVTLVSPKVLEKLSEHKHPEGIVTQIKIPQERFSLNDSFILLEDIQDPGNLGTIIRTADAAGFKQLVTTQGCADFYNEKTLRSAMGSIFHIDLIKVDSAHSCLIKAKKKNFELIGTDLNGTILRMKEVKVPERFVLIFGNESKGIKPETLELCSQRIKLPIQGDAESLNVAVAAGITMYAYMDS